MLATAFCCRLDGRTGQGTWVNAGHPPPVLCRPGREPVLLEGHGMALGVFAEQQYQAKELRLSAGDRLVIHTDGLTEALRPDGSRTGDAPLLALLASLALQAPDEIAAAIETRLIETAAVTDDLTIMVIQKL